MSGSGSSGTSSALLSSIGTSGIAASSAYGWEKYSQKKLSSSLKQVADSSTFGNYLQVNRLPGDVFFHVGGSNVGHTNMTGPDTNYKIDSVDPIGVRTIPIEKDKASAIVFRFFDANVARRASLIAADWVHAYNEEDKTYGKAGVGYSGGARGTGVTGRVIGALLGSSKFGSGAKARLMKYRNRVGMTPRHVICSEMAILAYQLAMSERDRGFIKLDAKHSVPSGLFKYMIAHPNDWKVIAIRHIN